MTSKKILFRADGNSVTGLGHMYRLFAFVEMLKDEYDYVYLTKENSNTSIIPKNYNHEYLPDNNNLSYNDEPNWLAKNYPSNQYILIIDGYQFISDYQKKAKSLGYNIIYIDDLAKEHMFADIVVNHAPGFRINDYSGEKNVLYALGTDYALLRPSFLTEASKSKEGITRIDTVFICFGGADYFDLTSKAVKGILSLKNIKKIKVVIGGAYKSQEIFELKKDNNSKLELYQNISEKNLVNVMSDCNLAIVPSSTILFEVCSVKMPVLSGYFVDNQKKIYESLKKNKIIIPAGDFSKYSISNFKNKIQNIIKQYDFSEYIDNQKKQFDGFSKHRLLGLINQFNISLKKATLEDLSVVYEWSNDSLVRKNSYNSESISFESHKNWYNSKIISDDTLFLIASINGKKAALIRFDLKRSFSVIGITLSEKYRGQKLASKLLLESSNLYFRYFDLSIHAYIKKENLASIKAFEKAKFKYSDTKEINGFPSHIYKLEKNEFR